MSEGEKTDGEIVAHPIEALQEEQANEIKTAEPNENKKTKKKRLKVLKKSEHESLDQIIQKAELKVKMEPDLYDQLVSTPDTASTIFNEPPSRSLLFGDSVQITHKESTVKKEISLKYIRGVKQIKDISEHYKWRKQLGAG